MISRHKGLLIATTIALIAFAAVATELWILHEETRRITASMPAMQQEMELTQSKVRTLAAPRYVDVFMFLSARTCQLITPDGVSPPINRSGEAWEKANNIWACDFSIPKAEFEQNFEYCALSGVSFHRSIQVLQHGYENTSLDCRFRAVGKAGTYSFEINGRHLDSCSWACKVRAAL